MRGLRAFVVRALAHLRPGTADRDIDEEMQYHLERLVERHVAAGMPPAAARDAARREFGNVGATGDAMRDAARWARLARFERDVRYALRSLRRSPLFALAVVLTIGIAIGLNASVFTFFDAYVLRPLAARDPSALHRVIVVSERKGERSTDTWMDWDQFEQVRRDSALVRDALSFRNAYTRIDQVPAVGELVSGNYFSMLGVGTILGRPIVPADVAGGADGFVVVLSHAAWKARFGGDPGIVGRTIALRGRSFTVVGVTDPAFTGLTEIAADFWAPATTAELVDGKVEHPAYPVRPRGSVVVRLAAGIPPEQARASIGRRLAAFAAQAPSPDSSRITGVALESRATAIPLTAETIAVFAPAAIAFILVLVIACANVANMMLARGLARQREIGIRMALGAGRGQVVGQLLAEAAVLAVPATVVGYVVSRLALDAGMRVLVASFPASFAAYLKVVPLDPDPRVFLFMLGLALVAVVVFGLVPALQVTRTGVVAATRGEHALIERGVRPGRLRNALVVVQMAACVLLMAVAAVLARGASQVRRLDPGFDLTGLVDVELDASSRPAALASLRALPFVARVEAAAYPPARGLLSGTVVRLPGSVERRFYYNRVSPGYFDATRTRLVAGRTFTGREAAGREAVVVLSETAARLLAPDGNAIGAELTLLADDTSLRYRGLTPFRTARVIGIVADAAPGLVIVPKEAPLAYYPMDVASAGEFLVSVRGDARRATRDIERDIDRLHQGAVTDISPLADALDAQLYPIRAASWLAGLLGIIALLLTVSGIYGVLAFLVAQRTREIGVRMALGAHPRAVVGLVVRQSVTLAALGAAIGIALAFVPSAVFSSENVVVRTFDPLAYAGTLAIALAASLAAAWIPSRRAASVNPLEAIRSE